MNPIVSASDVAVDRVVLAAGEMVPAKAFKLSAITLGGGASFDVFVLSRCHGSSSSCCKAMVGLETYLLGLGNM